MREEDFDYQHGYQQARDARWYAPVRDFCYKMLSIPVIVIGKLLNPKNKPNKLERNC